MYFCVLRSDEEYTYYEIKTELSARACVRAAIARLLEYSYSPGMKVAHALVVVGEPQLDEFTRQFLQRLSGEFGIPVRYIQYDRASGELLSWRTPCKMLPNIALLLTGLSKMAALLSMPASRILLNGPATKCKR